MAFDFRQVFRFIIPKENKSRLEIIIFEFGALKQKLKNVE